MVITTDEVLGRVKRVRKWMSERDLGALVLHSSPHVLAAATITSGNVRYLTNFPDTYMPSMFILPLREEPVLLGSGHKCEKLARDSNIWVKDVRGEEDPQVHGSVAREVLAERGVPAGRIGLVGRMEMTVPMYQGLIGERSRWEFEDADDLINEERAIKSPSEVKLHRAAAKISDTMLYAIMHGARVPGKSASQLIAEAEWTGRSLFADLATMWLAAGPVPDYIGRLGGRNMRQLQDGDRVQGGTYVTVEGYWAHELRMGIKGRPSPELKRYFKAVLEIQNIGLRELKPGVKLRDVVKAMERAIDEICPYPTEEDPLRFHTGHGLGLNYCDPLVSDAFPQTAMWSRSKRTTSKGGWRSGQESQLIVKPGMVMELHPNFSVPEHGIIAIGDVVHITESGAELLTGFPRELYEI